MYRTLLAALMPLALGLRGTSESLRKALVNVGLELTEQHLYGQQRSEEAPPFMVLMPGLARGCHSTELMRSYLSSCRAGTSALTMVFQFGHRTSKSPNDVLDEGACIRSVQAAALGSRCNVRKPTAVRRQRQKNSAQRCAREGTC